MLKIPSFKLSFLASQVTNLDGVVIIEKIVAKLHDKKYRVKTVSDSGVKFDGYQWRLVWNFQAPYLLDGGEFEIISSAQGIVLSLTYFIDTLYLLLLMAGMLTLMMVEADYGAMAFFGIFFLIAGTYQYFATKNAGKIMLEEILNKDLS